jgi:hypothetical protein
MKKKTNRLKAGDRVRLNCDLTRYHPELKTGAEGIVAADRCCFNATWMGASGVGVRFDKAGCWDILSDGLEIIQCPGQTVREATKPPPAVVVVTDVSPPRPTFTIRELKAAMIVLDDRDFIMEALRRGLVCFRRPTPKKKVKK